MQLFNLNEKSDDLMQKKWNKIIYKANKYNNNKKSFKIFILNFLEDKFYFKEIYLYFNDTKIKFLQNYFNNKNKDIKNPF